MKKQKFKEQTWDEIFPSSCGLFHWQEETAGLFRTTENYSRESYEKCYYEIMITYSEACENFFGNSAELFLTGEKFNRETGESAFSRELLDSGKLFELINFAVYDCREYMVEAQHESSL